MSKVFKLVIVLLILGVISGLSYSTYYYFNQNKLAQIQLANPQALNEKETAEIIAQVSKLMELPPEAPTIATVLDVEKLKEQPFFSKASNGDKVLIFTNAKKAILFRPSTSKIIEVDPISLDSQPTPTPTTKPKVEPTPTEEPAL